MPACRMRMLIAFTGTSCQKAILFMDAEVTLDGKLSFEMKMSVGSVGQVVCALPLAKEPLSIIYFCTGIFNYLMS